MREIVFDVETTGTDPLRGDRVVEIGAVELVNLVPTGCHYHQYINPEREVPAGAVRVHGLDSAFLSGYPVFAEIVDGFLGFIEQAPLIAHNADFDFGFIDAELRRLGLPSLDRRRKIDTLAMARRQFPGAQASLDALCRRFAIDNSGRELHGALLDSEILAEVYLELKGGRQPDLVLATDRPAGEGPEDGADGGAAGDEAAAGSTVATPRREARPPRPHAPGAAELERHRAFIEAELTDPLWRRFAETGG